MSPSDNILSPASQKLSQFRNKNLMKKYVDLTLIFIDNSVQSDICRSYRLLIGIVLCRAKPRTLFSRNNTENSVTMQSSDSKMHDESVGAVEE